MTLSGLVNGNATETVTLEVDDGQATDTDTVVNYVVTGTALAGADYTTLSGSVTILAGQTSAVIDVTVQDDSLPVIFHGYLQIMYPNP